VFFQTKLLLILPSPKKQQMTEHLLGASVLPVMLDPTQGTLYFLLAKERYHPSWLQGSCLWTDFGGRAQKGESAEQVVGREFVEETLGQVCFLEQGALLFPSLTEAEPIEQALKQHKYILQFTHVYNGSKFVTFVVQVPWDPQVSQRFTEARQSCDFSSTERCYLEKSDIRLFSVAQVLHAVQAKGYLTSVERCCPTLTQALSIILPELQFHFPHVF
jgi:hypothetical protein